MTEPQSVALIREALAAGPVGHLHSTGEYCSDRQASPDLWPIDLYAIDRRDIAEVLQHVAALEAQVRELEAQAAYMRERLEIYSTDAERYLWLREHPAFDTESALGAMSPEEFDAAVDAAREQ